MPSDSPPLFSSVYAHAIIPWPLHSSRTYPTPYTGATYTVLSGSTTNSTHWTLNVLAKGVSSFGTTKLNPAGSVSLAYAISATPPTEPANNASRFGIHSAHAKWSLDLKSAQIANFAQLAAKASAVTTA